jgi:hypothetical protein
MFKGIYKIGIIGWCVCCITFIIISVFSPFIYYGFNVNIFELISPIVMLRIGLISFGIILGCIIILIVKDVIFD